LSRLNKKNAGLGRVCILRGAEDLNPLLGYVWVVFWTIEEYHTHVSFMCPFKHF